MYCIKCGKLIPEGGMYCPYCGTPVPEENGSDSGNKEAAGGYSGYKYDYEEAFSERNGGFATAALVCAILSILLCFFPFAGIPLAVAGFAFGVVGRDCQRKRTRATAAIVISCICFAVGILIFLTIYRMMPELTEELPDLLPGITPYQ